MTDMQKVAEGPFTPSARFQRARTALTGISMSSLATLQGTSVLIALEAYEALAAEILRLRRELRDTPATQEMLEEIQEELDGALDDPNRIRLIEDSFITDVGHSVLEIIEAKTGVLP